MDNHIETSRTLRIPTSIDKQVVELAEKDLRSINQEYIYLVRLGIEYSKKLENDKK